MVSSTPTKASAWRDKAREVKVDGVLLELPSGNFAKIRRPSLADMLKQKQIPASLTQVALRQAGAIKGSSTVSEKELDDSIRLVDVILKKAFVVPEIVDTEPGEEQITLDDLTDEDRAFVFNYVQSGATSLKSFRSE